MQAEVTTECYDCTRPVGAELRKTISSVYLSEKAASYKSALPTQKRRYQITYNITALAEFDS